MRRLLAAMRSSPEDEEIIRRRRGLYLATERQKGIAAAEERQKKIRSEMKARRKEELRLEVLRMELAVETKVHELQKGQGGRRLGSDAPLQRHQQEEGQQLRHCG